MSLLFLNTLSIVALAAYYQPVTVAAAAAMAALFYKLRMTYLYTST